MSIEFQGNGESGMIHNGKNGWIWGSGDNRNTSNGDRAETGFVVHV